MIDCIDVFKASDIICASETWLSVKRSLSNKLDDYCIFNVYAERNQKMGRYKGGLSILINKKLYKCDLLFSDKYFIFVKIVTNFKTFIIGNVYISPTDDIDLFFTKLDPVINFIKLNHENVPLFIGGDFNARIGNSNQLDLDFFLGNFLYTHRSSHDGKLKKRGRKLIEFMENHFFNVLNGRSTKDEVANYTYIGPRGRSVIDLVWFSPSAIDLISNFEVLYFVQSSDHFPVCVRLHDVNSNECGAYDADINASDAPPRLKWKASLASDFQLIMSTDLAVEDITLDVDQMNETLTKSIVKTADTLHMTELNKIKQNFNHPWYDSECEKIKRDLRKTLRKCKKLNFNNEITDSYNSLKCYYKFTIGLKKN